LKNDIHRHINRQTDINRWNSEFEHMDQFTPLYGYYTISIKSDPITLYPWYNYHWTTSKIFKI